jgi:hypothetical protein
MEECSRLPNDPFYVSGEHWLHRHLLNHHLANRSRDGRAIKREVRPIEAWEAGPSDSAYTSNNRRETFLRKWKQGFYQRLSVAAAAAVFLITPMWLMVLENSPYTALGSTTAFVVVFGLGSAVFLESLIEVMSSTAAYAAVLVVFVGLVTET